MARRTKNSTNSPYKTTDTDTRDFPYTNGEQLQPDDFAAVIDDIAAMMERIVTLEAGGGGGGGGAGLASGTFNALSATFTVDSTGGAVDPEIGTADGKWQQVGDLVVAQLYIERNNTAFNYFSVMTDDLVALGLPAPAVIAPANNTCAVRTDATAAPLNPIFEEIEWRFSFAANQACGEIQMMAVYKAATAIVDTGAEQTVGQFAIPAVQIQVIGGSSAVNRNGLCRWVKTGRQVTATIKAYIGGTSNTQVGIETAWLLAQGLPTPSVSSLSPASDFPRCVPAAAQLRGSAFGWETPLSAYADFDDETYFRLIRASAGDISEIHAVLSYIVD